MMKKPTRKSLMKLLKQLQNIVIAYRVQNVRELRGLRRLYPYIPTDPEEYFGDLWQGNATFFSVSCMTSNELFELMKERRMYDIYKLVYVRRREPDLRIPRSPISFYSKKDYDELTHKLHQLRLELNVPRFSHSRGSTEWSEQINAKRLCYMYSA